MHLDASLAVEHIQPKKPTGTLIESRALDWNNFLLSCTNCNSCKGTRDVDLEKYFWRDRDNTFRALTYAEGGGISPADELSVSDRGKAGNTIRLTGLDKNPRNDARASDRRWFNRREAWSIAVEARKNLEQCNKPEMLQQIKATALSKGYWSIWMTVFQNVPAMLQHFIEAFPGTAGDCFDESKKPVIRQGGRV